MSDNEEDIFKTTSDTESDSDSDTDKDESDNESVESTDSDAKELGTESADKKNKTKTKIYDDNDDDDADADDEELDDDDDDDDDDVDEDIIIEDDEDDDTPHKSKKTNNAKKTKKTATSIANAPVNALEKSVFVIEGDDDDTDYSENEDDYEDNDEDYLQKFDEDIKQNYIVDVHPECVIQNYDEIAALSRVVRDKDNNIIDPLHKTIPILTKYERARILGQRAKQINSGARPFVKVPENVMDGYLIAEMELKANRIPFIIRRPLPGTTGSEYWRVKDLEAIY